MGSKKQDSNVVTERRLRPIYDCLDIGNNKSALQEAEKLLKKQPDLICAKALRALALVRLSRSVDATTVLSEIEQLEPDEEYTLQALTYCYRDLGQPEKIVSLYERATKKHPQNEEFLSHLMMAYVRIGEHKKQGHIAMQLYKLRPAKNPYYFWSVMSTVMQAYEDPKLARTMYLPLAERMIEKFLQSDKLNAEAEVKLYILILEMQEKYSEAVAVLQGNLMTRFVKCMWESNQKLVELLEKLERWQEVYDICEQRIPENYDDWFFWSHLLSSGFELIKRDPTRKLEVIGKLTSTVLSAITSDCKNGTPSCRGPSLARLRLISCLLERDFVVRSDLGTSPLGEPSKLLTEYFRSFGDKPSLFDDIEPFLWLLGEEQRNEFLQQLENLCGDLPVATAPVQSSDLKLAKHQRQMMMHQSALQLMRRLGCGANEQTIDKQTLVANLIVTYESALRLGADVQPTEIHPADNYLLLAVCNLWDLYVDSGDVGLIFETLLLCEQGLKRSPSNFRLKNLLMKLYATVGGGFQVLQVCESLDVKYILRETLWYCVCDQLTPWGLFAGFVEWSRTSLTFYGQSEKEIIDCVVQCYKSGSFPKIVEFFDFRKKLRNSFHFHACQVWQKYFTIINDGANIELVVSTLKGASSLDDLKSMVWSSCLDNCDYSIIPIWDPDESVKHDRTKRQEFLQQQIDQLRFYQIVLALLSLISAKDPSGHSSSDVAAPVDEDGAVGNGASVGNVVNKGPSNLAIDDSFMTILSELRAHCKHCGSKGAAATISSTVLSCPVFGFFSIYLAGSYLDVLDCVFESIFAIVKAVASPCHHFHSGSEGCNCAENRQLNDQTGTGKVQFPSQEETQHLLKAMFSSHQLHGPGSGFPFMQMCHISFLVQTLSIVLVAITLTLRRIRALQQHQHQSAGKDKKQKKKKGTQPTDLEFAEDSRLTSFLQFASIFCEAAETTLRLVEDLSMLLEADMSLCSLTETKFVPMEFCATKSETASKLRSSYKHSIKEFQRVMAQNLASVDTWNRAKDPCSS